MEFGEFSKQRKLMEVASRLGTLEILRFIKFSRTNQERKVFACFLEDIELKLSVFKEYNFSSKDKFFVISEEKREACRRELALRAFDIRMPIENNLFNEFIEKNWDFRTIPKELLFGIELECVGEKSWGLKLLNDKIFGYDVKMEKSVPNGIEFSSPKMCWQKDYLNSIYHISRFIKENGLFADERCGGHIHFSRDYLDSKDAWFWLYYLYSKCEMIFYLIVNRENTLPRENIMNYAKPFSSVFTNNLWRLNFVKTCDDFIKMVKNISEVKVHGLNLSLEHNTIEFRMPNGEVNSQYILENIILLGNLIVLAKKLSRLPLNEELYRLLFELENHELKEENKLEILLKLLFKEEKTREIFRKRYIINSMKYKNEITYPVLDAHIKSFSFKKAGILI